MYARVASTNGVSSARFLRRRHRARLLGIPDLIHLNGPACVGKSTIARLLVDARPLAIYLDIDDLRMRLGQWQHVEDSWQVACELAYEIAASHLRCSYDVVIPQLAVFDDFVERVAAIAAEAGATFHEIVLVADPEELVDRLTDAPHPRNAFSTDELLSQMRSCLAALPELAARDDTRFVDVGGLAIEAAYARVEDAVANRRPDVPRS